MRRATRSGTDRCRSNGFALIIVLWTLVLIAFITAHLVGSGRTEIRIASNLASNAVTEAAADGAVYQIIFRLLDPSADAAWSLDGTVREFAIGDCRIAVTLSDEAALINPNLASPALFEALLRVTGSDQPTARTLAASVAEWVGGTMSARRPDETAARYRAAGLDYAAPGEPLETLDELRRVLGMTPAILAAIRPHLSLFAPAEPSLAHADPIVAAAMAQTGAVPLGRSARQVAVLTARIAVKARGPNSARAAQTVIVRVSAQSRAYTVLSWRGDTE